MPEIAKRTNERRRELAAELEATFGNRADAEIAAALLVCWLKAECGEPISRDDRERYLAGLVELPKNAPLPRALYVSTYDAVYPRWEVTFVIGGSALESSLHFPTEAAAAEYAAGCTTANSVVGARRPTILPGALRIGGRLTWHLTSPAPS